jgi:hypothetical protein
MATGKVIQITGPVIWITFPVAIGLFFSSA